MQGNRVWTSDACHCEHIRCVHHMVYPERSRRAPRNDKRDCPDHDPESTFLDTPFPEVEVDAAAGLVRVDRRVVELSPKEFENQT